MKWKDVKRGNSSMSDIQLKRTEIKCCDKHIDTKYQRQKLMEVHWENK